MMRTLAFLITALLLFQITNSDPGSLILAQTADNGAPAEPSRRMDMTGIDLYMHDYAPTDGKPRKPTLWIHAEEGHAAEDEQVWQVEGVRAVIYGDENENANDLVVEADLGLFNLRENFARLNNDVTLKTGDIKLELDEIEWDNIKKVARSSSTVTVSQHKTRLIAESIVLDPNSGAFVLKNVSGSLHLEAESQ